MILTSDEGFSLDCFSLFLLVGKVDIIKKIASVLGENRYFKGSS